MKLPSAAEVAKRLTPYPLNRLAYEEAIVAYGRILLETAADEIADSFEDEEHYLKVRVVICKLKEDL